MMGGKSWLSGRGVKTGRDFAVWGVFHGSGGSGKGAYGAVRFKCYNDVDHSIMRWCDLHSGIMAPPYNCMDIIFQ